MAHWKANLEYWSQTWQHWWIKKILISTHRDSNLISLVYSTSLSLESYPGDFSVPQKCEHN